MDWIKQKVMAGERCIGVGAMLGSPMVVELIGKSGFDWVWIDHEHGVSGPHDYLSQMQAAAIHKMPAVVRLPANELNYFKQALDFGAAGVMVPYVNTAEEAAHAARCCRYSPDGLRGIAQSTRAAQFGLAFDDYFPVADENVLTVVQIETPVAVANADAIAAVEGVDCLFVGPFDLSVSMRKTRQFEDAEFEAALDTVLAACKANGKAAGILVPRPDLADKWMDKGFTFIVAGGDGGLMAQALTGLRAKYST